MQPGSELTPAGRVRKDDGVLWVLLGVRVTTSGLHRLPPGDAKPPAETNGGRKGGRRRPERASSRPPDGTQSKSPDAGRSSKQAPNPTCRAPLERKEEIPGSHSGGHTENQARPEPTGHALLAQAPVHLPRPLLMPQAGGEGQKPQRLGRGGGGCPALRPAG